MGRQILIGARLFDGERFHDDAALLIEAGRIVSLGSLADMPGDAETVALPGGLLAPGFIDAQVNGGGGVMLNDDPSPASMAAIVAAHRRFGTTALLPTLITDRPEAVDRAIAAAIEAVRTIPGVAGLHLEGPHLAPSRKGTHVAALMRPMNDAALTQLCEAAETLPALLLTVAVEQVTVDQIGALGRAGVLVSLGHTDASADQARAAFEAGATGVTHLFNAMSQLGHRAPGLVGAALDAGPVWCGLIADGHHVDPVAIRVALAAKREPGRIFLVTDAMSTVGSDATGFVLNGRTIERTGDRIALADGTLAGSHLDMAGAVRFAVDHLDVTLGEALRMASLYPARFLRLDDRGTMLPGARADLVHLDDGLKVTGTWISGSFATATS